MYSDNVENYNAPPIVTQRAARRGRETGAADAQREGAAAMARVAEQVNEQRFEIRQQINRSLLQIEEAIAERIGQLKSGLLREVEAGAHRYYFGDNSFEVESFRLND